MRKMLREKRIKIFERALEIMRNDKIENALSDRYYIQRAEKEMKHECQCLYPERILEGVYKGICNCCGKTYEEPCEHKWELEPGIIQHCSKCYKVELYKPKLPKG